MNGFITTRKPKTNGSLMLKNAGAISNLANVLYSSLLANIIIIIASPKVAPEPPMRTKLSKNCWVTTFGNALWAAKATAFCYMAANQIAVITPETTLAPWIPKVHKNKTNNSQINTPGKLVPTTDNGLKMYCIKFGIVSIGVKPLFGLSKQAVNRKKTGTKP